MEHNAYRYRFGTAEFDEARFELKVAGLPVEVERRALEVLLYLLRHAGEVVTKDELLQEVWAGRVTVEKVLPNAINKLRRALGESNAACVTTQARIGYRLDAVVTRTAVGSPLTSQLALEVDNPVPGRANFRLRQLLGRTLVSEVWLAEHAQTREQRVYKFSVDGQSLRSLKREVTLMRVLQESLGESPHFVRVIDWNFEHAPFFLESQYAGLCLDQWAEQHLHALDTAARLNLFLQIADAVAMAHSVGVLHKDLKPSNVLVTGGAQAPCVRLSDFGSGQLMDPERLAQLGITRHGLTVEDQDSSRFTSGTVTYVAPELFDGQAPTIKSDVFALGLILYQLLTNRFGLPMASGWEANIDDVLLRADIRRATDGNPALRTSSAGELAQGLRDLERRRHELQAQQQDQETARRLGEALARTRARRPFVLALIATLAAGVVVVGWLLQTAIAARDQAQRELKRTTALTRFLDEDLIGRSNPLLSAGGADTTLRQALLDARNQVDRRFANDPQSQIAVRENLATLFNTLDLFKEAEQEARQTLALHGEHDGDYAQASFRARALLVRVLSRQGRLDEAGREIEMLERQIGSAPSLEQAQLLAAARSTRDIGKGDFAAAEVDLREAIAGLHKLDRDTTVASDSLRLDYITVLVQRGKTAEAKAQAQALIDAVRAHSEEAELWVALTQLAVARAYRDDDPAEAERRLLAARPVIVSRLGENHTRHLQLLGELLSVAFHRNDWKSAVQYAQLAHERVRAKLGDKHALTFVTLANWARTLSESGQALASQQKAREAYQSLLQIAGPKSPQTQDAAFVYTLSELDLGHVAEAEEVLPHLEADVLESGRATGQWPQAIDALRGIALALRGKHDDALKLLDTSLETLKPEDATTPPERLYVVASAARDRVAKRQARPDEGH